MSPQRALSMLQYYGTTSNPIDINLIAILRVPHLLWLQFGQWNCRLHRTYLNLMSPIITDRSSPFRSFCPFFKLKSLTAATAFIQRTFSSFRYSPARDLELESGWFVAVLHKGWRREASRANMPIVFNLFFQPEEHVICTIVYNDKEHV